MNWITNFIRRLVLWDYKRHVRRHTPNIPAKDHRTPEQIAAGMGGHDIPPHPRHFKSEGH